ncbi:MAG: BamA/TamA family outer membrane protein, partial [Candidatus Latescibacteria bacterium]|nr:BamA/TamA family outer membrane protein [Candidatus Latescibacterota bacterium]
MVSAHALKAQVVTKGTPWYDWVPFVKPRIFDAGLFRSDVDRLLQFYDSQGFTKTKIDTTLQVWKNGTITVNMHIEEGPRLYIGGVRVAGIDSTRLVSLYEDLNSLIGKPFVPSLLTERVTNTLRSYRNLGYAFAKVEVSTYLDSLLVNVDVGFELGPVCHVSDIQVTGNVSVSERTVRRGLTFDMGQLVEGKKLDDSRRQLYRSGVFRSVILDFPDTVAAQTPVRIRVSERPFKSIRLGGGYDTEVGLRASASWLHRNFGGGAKQLRISGSASTESRDLVVGIRQAYFGDSRNWLNLSGFIQKRKQSDDEQNEVGGRASFERNVTDNLDFVLQLSGGVVGTTTDSAFSDLRASLRWDTRDDLFDPQEGALASVTVRERGWWLQSAWEFWEIKGEGRWFVPLPLNSVLGVRALGGGIFQIHKRQAVPDIERYYRGGLNSVRGWGYQKLGPKVIQETDEIIDGVPVKTIEVVPLGGTSHLEGSIELRTRVLDYLGTALFIDGGKVANEFDILSFAELKWSVGGGLRLLTPVGPIRF